MSARDKAERIVARWEGFRPAPYRCPAGVPTIGYGTTRYESGVAVAMTDPPIDEPRAYALLWGELGRCEASVLRMCPRVADEPEGRLAALTSFVYNLGAGRLQASTLRHYVNDGQWDLAAGEFRKWVWAGGRKLPGLVARRVEEAAVFIGSESE